MSSSVDEWCDSTSLQKILVELLSLLDINNKIQPTLTLFYFSFQAAVKEARGDLFGAIQYLKEYLAVHMVDVVAWEHIATLYLRVGALPQAIFCLEEVIMHQPGNINALLLLAETLYAAGGDANLAASRGYFTGVIEVSGGRNVRALYGACACAALAGGTKKAGGSQKGQGSKGDEGAKELGRLAGEALLQRYGVSAEAKLPLVKAMLTSQGLL